MYNGFVDFFNVATMSEFRMKSTGTCKCGNIKVAVVAEEAPGNIHPRITAVPQFRINKKA